MYKIQKEKIGRQIYVYDRTWLITQCLSKFCIIFYTYFAKVTEALKIYNFLFRHSISGRNEAVFLCTGHFTGAKSVSKLGSTYCTYIMYTVDVILFWRTISCCRIQQRQCGLYMGPRKQLKKYKKNKFFEYCYSIVNNSDKCLRRTKQAWTIPIKSAVYIQSVQLTNVYSD